MSAGAGGRRFHLIGRCPQGMLTGWMTLAIARSLVARWMLNTEGVPSKERQTSPIWEIRYHKAVEGVESMGKEDGREGGGKILDFLSLYFQTHSLPPIGMFGVDQRSITIASHPTRIRRT